MTMKWFWNDFEGHMDCQSFKKLYNGLSTPLKIYGSFSITFEIMRGMTLNGLTFDKSSLSNDNWCLLNDFEGPMKCQSKFLKFYSK